jgi:hypothetical protein
MLRTLDFRHVLVTASVMPVVPPTGTDDDIIMIIIIIITCPWSRILLKKLIVTELVKKFPCLLYEPKVNYRVYKSPPLAPILIRMNSIHTFPSYFPKIHSHIIFPFS